MRLLLVNIGNGTEIRIPQGLLYLASAVQAAGHTVTTHDEALAEDWGQSLEQILASEADIIGLSVYTVPWQLRRVEEISRAVKAARKSTQVMWGGWHPTLYPRHCILNENVDIVVRGPGEKPVCEILESIAEGRSLSSISGLLIKEDGRIIDTGPECLDPRYLYPPLNYKVMDFETYLRRHDRGPGILQYITSRGCHGRCRFCVMSRLFKGCLIRKPRDQILTELEVQLGQHNINTIHFSDDNTFRNDAEALELCEIVMSVTNGKGIPWRCATRIDTMSRLSTSTCEKLAASGCKGVVVGIESGVDRVLKLMRKGITVSQIHKALAAIRENGLDETLFFFLFGFTGETKKEAEETLAMARRIRLMLRGCDISLHVYFPGASDSSWLGVDLSPAEASRLSEVFAEYYAQHITGYRIAGTRIRTLRYYFGASRRSEDGPAGRMGLLRMLLRKLMLYRIEYGVFALPFEYYLSSVVVKHLRRALRRFRLRPKRRISGGRETAEGY
jgi:radical SAM superfamily enzyme YgiQ (UPF0313 family)